MSDSTGETATRLVHALEAQFPDQTFEEIRHPRVESVEDLELAVGKRARPPRRRLLHARQAGAARRDAARVPAGARPLLRPARASRSTRSRASPASQAQGRAGARAPLDSGYFRRIEAIEFAVALRRRDRRRPRRGGRRARRRLAHVEDAALDVPREHGLQDRERADRRGHRAAAGSLPDQPGQGRRPDDRRRTGSREIRQARARNFGGTAPAVLRAREDLRGARAGGGDPPAARLSR